MRGGTWALDSTPWERELSLAQGEWGVAWGMMFGGLARETLARIDDPIGGFAFRGARMESAVMEAVRESIPPATVRLWAQPGPEMYPVDHAARCEAGHSGGGPAGQGQPL